MNTHWSKFGRKLGSHTGIMELMDDLGQAMTGSREMIMMGGGNPAAIPEVQAIFRERMEALLAEGDEFDRMLVNYDPPRGNPRFIEALTGCLNEAFGWTLKPENIAVTAGGQTAFFLLFNMLAKEGQRILLPLMPEYIGYADQGIEDGLFLGKKPRIERFDAHTFKYFVDFDHLSVDDDVAAICVSRPTNPTGNVLTDEEIRHLSELADRHNIPLIIDNAYGAPFPHVIFDEVTPVWNENIILTLSLSKLGLPGTRTGIVIAREEVTQAISSMMSVVGLANTNVGQSLVRPLLESGKILELSKEVIQPFYLEKSRQAIEWVHELFDDDLPWHLHKSEGAIFLWMWFPDLPIDTRELYERLKARGVLIVPGCYFFYGLDESWAQQHECIRMTFTQPGDKIREGLRIIAEEVKKAYGQVGG